jgi:hypothetical protein
MLKQATLRLHAVSLAVASFVVLTWLHAVPGWFDRFGTLRGVDFIQFYAAGWQVLHGQASHLYDWDAFSRLLSVLAPGIGDLLFLSVYPPQLALLFAPLGQLSYLQALALWTLVSLALYVAAARALLRTLPALRTYRLEAWCFAIGFTPFLQLVAHGQIASLALPLLVAACYAFRANHPLMVGLALGSLIFKPQLGTFALAALVFWPSWRLLAGLTVSAAAQLGLVALTLGTGLLRDYLDVVQRLARSPGVFEHKLWAMHSLRSACELILGQTRVATACWLIGAAGVVWLGRRAWCRHQSSDVRFALICLVGLLLNPHLYIYDLVLMAVPLACIAARLVERHDASDTPAQYLVLALVWAPLLGPLAAITHVQLTSPAMIALTGFLGFSRGSRVPLAPLPLFDDNLRR